MIVVRNVQINKVHTGSVKFSLDKHASEVLAEAKGRKPTIRIWKDGKAFYANALGDVGTDFLVQARTPAKAFAKAVKQFWSN